VPLPAMVLDPLGLPALQPGLFDAATGPLDLPAHAQTSGAIYTADSCGEARLYPAPCATPPYPTMLLDPNDSLVPAYVFNVYASTICGSMGQSFTEAERRVRARLQMSEQRAVELAFWGGDATVDSVIHQESVAGRVTVLTAATTTVEAVSVLEQQMATIYGGVPLIHARPRMGAYLGAAGVLTEKNPARTHYGSVVVLGAGYAGNSPDEVTAPNATTEFMLATGRVILWRSEVFVPPSIQMLNRTTNQLGLYAMRTYAIAVECGAAAVQVTRT
jgi:hypothetical protein